MQTEPEVAKVKYANDKEVTNFMTEFSKLMGTHFQKLDTDSKKFGGNKQKKEQKKQEPILEKLTPKGNLAVAGIDDELIDLMHERDVKAIVYFDLGF